MGLTSACVSPGSATTVASNPFWVIQTTQTSSHTLKSTADIGSSSTTSASDSSRARANLGKRPGFFETVERILRKDGAAAFWRGLGPALVLVVNPVLQYTVFEQLKNALVRRRSAAGKKGGAAVLAVLSDLDYFFLGALAKLGTADFFTSISSPFFRATVSLFAF